MGSDPREALLPQVALLAIAGTALYAGMRLASRILEAQAEALRKAEATARTRAAQGTPKDLGALEWDERTGVYRPRG